MYLGRQVRLLSLWLAGSKPYQANVMPTIASKAWDMLRLIRHGGPALCNIAVTNSCNATCDFCNFANGKVGRNDLRWINAEQVEDALEILYRRGIRYVSFFGGEPLLHPRLPDMIAMAATKGMGPALITNGWLLSSKLDQLAASGLKTVYVSIDAPRMADHEANRGLKGLGERIRCGHIENAESRHDTASAGDDEQANQ